jgi:hypothetical protein
MLILNPRTVTFGSSRWDNVQSVSIDRRPRRIAEDWSDAGPYAVFADVPEQSLRIAVVQELSATDLGPPAPGGRATLSFCTSPAAADRSRQRLTTDAVVLQVTHGLSLKGAPTRTILLAPLSASGAADPVTVTDASDGTP